MMRPSVLVVDGGGATRERVFANLEEGGYEVVIAGSGQEAVEALGEHLFDLIVLDVRAPPNDGLELLSELRRRTEVPVIVLSPCGAEDEKVAALDLGADDYLGEPFGAQELLARVRALLRRADSAPRGPLSSYRRDALEVDFCARRVRLDGADVALTPQEYGVLAYLARHAGKVRTHRQILQAVWGPRYGEESEYLWTYVRRLRRKIEPDLEHPSYLLTEPGVGYGMPSGD